MVICWEVIINNNELFSHQPPQKWANSEEGIYIHVNSLLSCILHFVRFQTNINFVPISQSRNNANSAYNCT